MAALLLIPAGDLSYRISPMARATLIQLPARCRRTPLRWLDFLQIRKEPNRELVLGDSSVSVLEGVVLPWGVPRGHLRATILDGLAAAMEFELNTPRKEDRQNHVDDAASAHCCEGTDRKRPAGSLRSPDMMTPSEASGGFTRPQNGRAPPRFFRGGCEMMSTGHGDSRTIRERSSPIRL
ncbi:hypothetical protein BH23GEM6_BH23GEM6_19810 [soil metagenome]